MTAAEGWRREIQSLLPGGFLRRDRQTEYLFASDYPARCLEPEKITRALEDAGFTVRTAGGIAHLDASFARYRALAQTLDEAPTYRPDGQTLPLYLLALRLIRTGKELIPAAVPLLRSTIKCLDAGDEAGLLSDLPPRIAQLQRQKFSPPRAAGQMILTYLACKNS